jgi:hypothetical protein
VIFQEIGALPLGLCAEHGATFDALPPELQLDWKE